METDEQCTASWWLDSGVTATDRRHAARRMIAMLQEFLANREIVVDFMCECEDCEPCPCDD